MLGVESSLQALLSLLSFNVSYMYLVWVYSHMCVHSTCDGQRTVCKCPLSPSTCANRRANWLVQYCFYIEIFSHKNSKVTVIWAKGPSVSGLEPPSSPKDFPPQMSPTDLELHLLRYRPTSCSQKLPWTSFRYNGTIIGT